MTASWEYSDTLQQIKKEASRYLPPDELQRQSDAGDPVAQYHQAKELMPTRHDEGAATAGYPQAQYEMASSYRHRKRTAQDWGHSLADSLQVAITSLKRFINAFK